MASYVVKVQFEDGVRRLTLGSSLSYEQLVSRTRDLFKIPGGAQLVLTYVDRDGDVVTMAEDGDLQDALVLQSLNPLRVKVTVLGTREGGLSRGSPSNGEVHRKGSHHENQNAAVGVDGKGTNEEVALNTDSPSNGEVHQKGSHKENQNAAVKADGKGMNEEVASAPAAPAHDDSVKAPDTKAEVDEQPVHYGITCDDCSTRNIRGTRYKSLKKEDYDLCGVCFGKPGVDANEYIAMKTGRPDRRFNHRNGRFAGCDTRNTNFGVHRRGFEHPMVMHRRGGTGCAGGICENGKFTGGSGTDVRKQTANPATAGGEAFHYGVTCDDCKACPIVGPRFKSNKKYNYDLCQGCVQKIEGPASDEYTRIDNPVPQLYPHALLKRYYGVSPTYSSCPFAAYGRPRSPRRIYVAAVIPQKVESDATSENPATESKTASEGATEESAAEDHKVGNEANPQTPVTESKAAPEGAIERDGVSNVSNVETKGATSSEDKITSNVHLNEAKTGDGANRISENNGIQNGSHPKADVDGLVSKLASMGFTDKKLNEQLLQNNNFDLRSTVDALCAADDWDPILEELQEMGFYDSDLNRQLLFQNNGSIKRVVKELVESEKVGRNKFSNGEKLE